MVRGADSIRARLATALVVGALLMAIPLMRGVHSLVTKPWSMPRTPSDRSPGGAAAWWHFLDQAAEHLPAGATYTIWAPDGHTEMRLFMVAMGRLFDRNLRPTSYLGTATEDIGGSAEYVLVFRSGTRGEDLELAATVDDGGVYRRRAAAP